MPEQPSFSQQLIALGALTAVSTAIGFTMKFSQVGGKYKFSPASAVVMTELFKLLSSMFIVWKLLLNASKERSSPIKEEWKRFWVENAPTPVFYHQAGLAIAYSIVNLVTYLVFVHASASMFFLLKAASPVITAIMLASIGRNIARTQWIAVAMQGIGLVVTQYNPCTKSSVMPVIGYIFIAINIGVSCAAGVWNEFVIKTYGASVNAQNVILYSYGVVINLIVFWVAPPWMLGLKEPLGFFEGYNWSVVAVVVANGSIGLVITAVYKYADVVVKTFGLAGSTVTLFLIEAVGILPKNANSAPTSVIILGASVVFYAAYLYIAPPPSPKQKICGDTDESTTTSCSGSGGGSCSSPNDQGPSSKMLEKAEAAAAAAASGNGGGASSSSSSSAVSSGGVSGITIPSSGGSNNSGIVEGALGQWTCFCSCIRGFGDRRIAFISILAALAVLTSVVGAACGGMEPS